MDASQGQGVAIPAARNHQSTPNSDTLSQYGSGSPGKRASRKASCVGPLGSCSRALLEAGEHVGACRAAERRSLHGGPGPSAVAASGVERARETPPYAAPPSRPHRRFQKEVTRGPTPESAGTPAPRRPEPKPQMTGGTDRCSRPLVLILRPAPRWGSLPAGAVTGGGCPLPPQLARALPRRQSPV